jgi:pimeloyl-ACP methyl ester carboxylesterase
MTHGWPGSVMEMIDSVGPLTDPTAHGGRAEDAFDLVLPSLPGYGFSGEPVEVGWDLGRTARAWDELMRRIGYTRYAAQGGDVGAGVTDAMGRQAPEGLIGIHTNLLVPALSDTMPTDTDEERAAAAQIATFQQSGNGYFVEMATRPQTIGYALLDSPVALAAWMIDHDTDSYYKIARAFVDGQPAGNLTRDNVLDNITAYWLTGTGASAARSYWEAYDPGRLHDVPGRDLADSAQLGREVVPQRHLLQRSRPGRPLRRVGRAGAVLNRVAGGFQVVALIGARAGPSTPQPLDWGSVAKCHPSGVNGTATSSASRLRWSLASSILIMFNRSSSCQNRSTRVGTSGGRKIRLHPSGSGRSSSSKST